MDVLVHLIAYLAPSLNFSANSWTSSSIFSSSTTSVIKPIFNASSASIISPVRRNFFALAYPINWGHITQPPSPATNPTDTCGSANLDRGVA